MIRLMIALVTCLGLWLTPAASQAQVADVAEPSSNDLAEFTRLLSDTRIQNWIAAQATDAGPNDSEQTQSLNDQLTGIIGQLRTRIGALGAAWRALRSAPADFAAKWRTTLKPGEQVRGLTFVLIFLFVGAGLEWLFRQYTNPLKLRIELNPVETVRGRITAAGLRALIMIAGLTIFDLGSIGAFAAFSWPPTLEAFVLNLLVMIFLVRAIHTVIVFFLAPAVQELRLVPISNALAKRLSRILLGLAGAYILAATLSGRFAAVTGGNAETPQVIGVTITFGFAALLITYLAIFLGFRSAHHAAGKPLGKAGRLWRLYLVALATLAFAAFVLNRMPLMGTILALGLLVPCLKLLRAWVDTAFDRAMVRLPAALPPVGADNDGVEFEDRTQTLHPYESYRAVSQRGVRFLALFTAVILLTLIWGFNVFERAEAPTVAGRAFALLIDSAVALLIADLVWVWASSAIDRRLDAYRPPEPGTAPGPEARMATLLPLLRVTLMITLLAMVIMSFLTSLGVNVAPLLAGAGVVGVAIGFGAQSLVKDVVSGIFFLIDDAFRVGEYVEIENLRGTVERISIRSLQIRHHRGAVHTLPFGELRHLTNHSRDWVIVKLEFRVPFNTDLQLVKKLIKSIGAKLQANEEYGAGILETLKSQGVRRMEEFNMVVGVKFMTRPGEQWLVRRDAYQMVRDAFDANGIRMAERNVKVEVADADRMTDAERKAVAGAAQQAIERQAGPGAPIPDEP